MIKKDHITLGQFLKLKGVIPNGGYAKIFLLENKVLVNGELENRRGRKLYSGDVIKIKNATYKVDDQIFES